MRLRNAVLAGVFVSAFVANMASALGLGEIKLKSTLNQPLNAEIQLLDTRDLNERQIIVGLAAPADFERSGVDRLFFYTELQFEVVLDNPGGAVIKVTSQSPVREPFLNFLVEARWSAGRLLREYTLLMDLPTFNEAAPQAAEAPQANIQAPVPAIPVEQNAPRKIERLPVAQEPVEATSMEQAADETGVARSMEEATPKKSKSVAGTYGPITQGETLWEIALAVRPDSNVSVYQTMMALQRLNPDAFIRNNVNLVKKGQVLRVPDSAEISNLTHKDAVAEFNSQLSEWASLVNSNANSNTSSQNLAPELDATRAKSSSHVAEVPVAGRVTLESPSAASGSGQGNGANKGKGKALEKDLAATLEELDKAKSENSELNSRVNSLENQTKTMQKLVDVSSDKLRAMQVNAQKSGEAAKSLESSVAVSSAMAEVSSVAVSSIAASAPATLKKPEPVKPKVAEPTLVDKLMENISWIALGLLVVAVGVIFFLRNRNKAETKSYSASSDDIFEPDASFDHFNHLKQDDQFDHLDDEVTPEEDFPAEAETDDPAGESEIYISLGQYDRAEDILLKGLVKEPKSADIRLKLLEVYSHQENAPEFEKHYKVFAPTASPAALARAKELRLNIPGVSLVDDEKPAQKSVSKPSNFIEQNPLAEAKEIPMRTAFTPASSPVIPDDDLIDIDLDDDVPSFDATESDRFAIDLSDDVPSSQAAEEESDFSFDLDLDSPATEKPEELAEDLSHISFAIDEMDEHDQLPELDDDTSESSAADEEFSFDFNDVDEPEEKPAAPQKQSAVATPVASPKNDDTNDDFDLEMEMGDVDLAALDREMESLDADLDVAAPSLDTPQSRNFEKLRAALDDVDIDEVHDEMDLDQKPLDLDREPIAEPVEASPTKIRKFDLATDPMTVEDSHEDDVFNEALSDFNSDDFSAENSANLTDDEMDSELDFMADADEAATKLDLARAYIDMGDNDGARDILAEVVQEGNEQQKSEAEQLLGRIGHA